MNTKIFVASSQEGKVIAAAIQENLEDFRVTVWKQNIFKLSDTTLDSLINALDQFDFGVFVFSPDDIIEMKGQQETVARDNVVFELGLFMGRMGKERNFIVIPKGIRDFHLPTDLAGLIVAKYDPNWSNLVAAVGVACNKIRSAINELSLKDDTQSKIEYEQYVGTKRMEKCVIIAHCDDASKFVGIGVLSPGGAIVNELRKTSLSMGLKAIQVKPDETPEWYRYSGKSTFFIVDSPHDNPYTRWILKHYDAYLAGGTVKFVEDISESTVKQKILTGSKLFESDKKEGMSLFDNFEDYLLIMRLPGIVSNMSQHATDISKVDKTRIIWVIAGIHSKASYIGAMLFAPENIKKFVAKLPNEYRIQPPDYFEAVYNVPRIPNRVEDFSKLTLEHFSLLRLKSEICVEDGVPAGLSRFFATDEGTSLQNIPIHTVHLDPVAACDFKCPHCIERKERSKRLFLSLNTTVRILCDLREIRCCNINFYGGEPTLHPSFSTILRLASNMGFRMNIVTNGSLLHKEDIRKTIIQNARQIILRISLDGNSPETHAANHGLRLDNDTNYFNRIRDSAVEFINKGVPVVISFLLFDNCIAEIEKACNFWKSKGATAFSLRPVTRVNGKKPKLDYEYAKLNTIKKIIENSKGWVIVPTWFREFLTINKKPDDANSYEKCYSAYYRFVISPYKINNTTLNESRLEETDKAWISLCSYRRYHKKYGCEYPKDLKKWAQEERIKIIQKIRPWAGDCKGIICCRGKQNQIVAEEIKNYTRL